MIIYKITNLINQKCYVGQTIRPIEQRWDEHCNDKTKNSYIHRAIQKYGKENFKIEIIWKTNNLNLMECFFIRQLNSTYPNGYNLTFGGEGGKKTEEAKRKMGLSKMGNTFRKGKKFGPCPKISIAQLGKKRGQQSLETIEKRRVKLLGIKKSEITKDRISKTLEGNTNAIRKKVMVTEKKTGIQICFFSVADASRELNYTRTAFNNVLCGYSKSTRKYNIEYINFG